MAGWGCQCRSLGSCSFREPRNDGKRAVFVGQVKSLFFEETRKEWLHQMRVRLRVVEAFTGVVGNEFEVRTGLDDGDCGVSFVPGRTYLIDAYRTKEGIWLTSICSGTAEATEAAEHISQLRDWKSGRVRTRVIVGSAMRVSVKEVDPRIGAAELGDLPVVAIAGGKAFPAVTTKAGNFEIKGLPAAEFKIQITDPGWAIRKTVVTGDLRTKSCAQVFLWASPWGSPD